MDKLFLLPRANTNKLTHDLSSSNSLLLLHILSNLKEKNKSHIFLYFGTSIETCQQAKHSHRLSTWNKGCSVDHAEMCVQGQSLSAELLVWVKVLQGRAFWLKENSELEEEQQELNLTWLTQKWKSGTMCYIIGNNDADYNYFTTFEWGICMYTLEYIHYCWLL